MRTVLISLAFFVMLLPLMSWGQSSGSSTSKSSGPKPVMSAEGFRMGIIHMKSSTTVKTPDNDGEKRRDETVDYSGVTIGYSYIPVNQVGCILNLAYLQNDNTGEYTISRLEASLTSGFNTRVSGKIGINGSLQNFKDRMPGLDPKAGAGLNVGLGFQLNKALGLDLTYMSMNQQLENNNQFATYRHQGLEFSLHATF